MTQDSPEFIALRNRLNDSLFPFWFSAGVDRVNGGFLERMSVDGSMLDDPRRARLVGRQIYSAVAAARLGWDGPAREIVEHGLDFLTTHSLRGDVIRPVVTTQGEPVVEGFDLYDHAFVLFGLAAAAGFGVRKPELTTLARSIRDRMCAGWKHPLGGFEESDPPSLPLKANPHMHILEASLAWAAVDDDPAWGLLADEIVELCLKHFLHPETGALQEYFDADWRPLTEAGLDVVEPGHQFEWAWLLIRWGRSRGRPDALEAARTLIRIAEERGVSPMRMAVNELNQDLSVRDDRHRLWPQTERIKAFVALGALARTEAEATAAREKTAEAATGLLRFFDHPVQGAWWEHINADGAPSQEPSRASSLYHITCAVGEMASLSA